MGGEEESAFGNFSESSYIFFLLFTLFSSLTRLNNSAYLMGAASNESCAENFGIKVVVYNFSFIYLILEVKSSRVNIVSHISYNCKCRKTR